MKKIMVVDDDRHVASLIMTLLNKLGYIGQAFDSAESALKAWEGDRGAFSCGIFDIWLHHGMDGFQLYKQIEAARPGFPVLFCTGLRDTDNVERLKEHGLYLPKEFWAKDGIAAIEELMTWVKTL